MKARGALRSTRPPLLCSYHFRGDCRFGATCTFIHVRSRLLKRDDRTGFWSPTKDPPQHTPQHTPQIKDGAPIKSDKKPCAGAPEIPVLPCQLTLPILLAQLNYTMINTNQTLQFCKSFPACKPDAIVTPNTKGKPACVSVHFFPTAGSANAGIRIRLRTRLATVTLSSRPPASGASRGASGASRHAAGTFGASGPSRASNRSASNRSGGLWDPSDGTDDSSLSDASDESGSYTDDSASTPHGPRMAPHICFPLLSLVCFNNVLTMCF
jgi:hypothetical protein